LKEFDEGEVVRDLPDWKNVKGSEGGRRPKKDVPLSLGKGLFSRIRDGVKESLPSTTDRVGIKKGLTKKNRGKIVIAMMK